jgi:hypothetical protein
VRTRLAVLDTLEHMFETGPMAATVRGFLVTLRSRRASSRAEAMGARR